MRAKNREPSRARASRGVSNGRSRLTEEAGEQTASTAETPLQRDDRRPPGEGERSARRGYVYQDRASARLIYQALIDRSLRWIGLADRAAGVADDLVLGLADALVAHQFKRSSRPVAVGINGLLLGAGNAIADLVAADVALHQQFPTFPIQIRYLTNNYPSDNDRLIEGDETSSTAEFIESRTAHVSRTLDEWRATRWAPLFNRLIASCGHTEAEFERFWHRFDLVMGPAATAILDPAEDGGRQLQINELAHALSSFIADNADKDRWSRQQLLDELGWRDRFALRFAHDFPVGAYVQRNEATEARLSQAIAEHTRGYLSVVGPPGAGKSTLLQSVLREHPRLHVIRYLAFVPGAAQGQGRGEADFFYDDANAQLAATFLKPLRVKDDTTQARQEAFAHLLSSAGEEYASKGIRYLIVVDGLDHIPREERPARSLLAALPLPQSVPDGVIFVLGTQRLDLDDLSFAVREQAGQSTRRVDITPLSERAVAAMARALGLPRDISPRDVHRVGRGHPLVTRYLIERLISADVATRDELLEGHHGFGADLEAVYDAAWRGIEQALDNAAVIRVLSLLARAQGPIQPGLLAQAISGEAVEAALSAVGYLLQKGKLGWSIFHNSFRLYLQSKPILRFGLPDADFQPANIYLKLAMLAKHAASPSPQRWLSFRYLYLAGAFEEALELATRQYFVQQYCTGRSAYDVRRDVSDAVRMVKARPDTVKLFDLMLADDEIDRRATIMESATSLVDAYISVGDLDAASAALEDEHEDGKQWLVIDALLEAREVDQARLLFDRASPYRSNLGKREVLSTDRNGRSLAWAERAVLFLDESQLDQEVSESLDDDEGNGDKAEADPDATDEAKFRIARAIIRTGGRDIARVAHRWNVATNSIPILLLEGAEVAVKNGENERATDWLRQASVHEGLRGLHSSWPLSASHLAMRIGERDLAQTFLALVPLEGLRAIEASRQSEQVGQICSQLVASVAIRAELSIELPELATPKDRLLKGVQHHLVALARATGCARSDRPISSGEISRLTSSAIHFLAVAQVTRNEDWYTSYLLPRAAEAIGEALFNLVRVSRSNPEAVSTLVDSLIANGAARFRWWPGFRRLIASKTYMLTRDNAAALTRLEAGLADLNMSDPREEITERSAYAAAIGEIGETGRAFEVLAALREAAFGIYLPAKKDGQYTLWARLLARANSADPSRRHLRAATSMRLLAGLKDTEGSDMGWRVCRQFVFEAAAADSTAAWQAAKAASGFGLISWDGIIDAVLRGLLSRNSALSDVTLSAWSHLCLPWYREPHGSTTTDGQFLIDLISGADGRQFVKLEATAAASIDAFAQPDMKLTLLAVLQEAAAARGGGESARSSMRHWRDESTYQEEISLDEREYPYVISMSDLVKAAKAELQYREEKKDENGSRATTRSFSYGLRRAAIRAIGNAGRFEIEAFAADHSALAGEPDIALALARAAMRAGSKDVARAIVAPFMDPEAEGWGGWGGSRRLRLHEIRHLLGEPDAFIAACTEFIDDLVRSRYGNAGTLWIIDDVFPLLFETVPWPDLWDRLDEQICLSRDYRLGRPMQPGEAIGTDAELLAEMFSWALTLGVPLINREATRGVIELLKQGHTNLFVAIVDRLLSIGGEATMLAMDLLTQAVTYRELRDIFFGRLQALADHPDAGVAAGALYLSAQWNVSIVPEARDLPAFYQLHLPPQDSVRGQSAFDTHTRGMVIEDPLGWTEAWSDLVERIAECAGLEALQIRLRARQFISIWGGVEKYGHSGSTRLEAELNKLSLKLPYRRPQAEASLRALRHVVCELWRARRIPMRNFRILLNRLRVNPNKAEMPDFERRPSDVRSPRVARMMWTKEGETWLDAVTDDLSTAKARRDRRIIAEWRRSVIREIRNTYIAELWCSFDGAASSTNNPSDLTSVIGALPQVTQFDSPLPLYTTEEISPSRIALYDPHELQGDMDNLLIFCPLTAETLGWMSDSRAVHLYRDDLGQVMARTLCWRDGLPQPIDHDERVADGQFVILSEAGLRSFQAMFGPLQLSTMAWRRIEAAEGDGTPGERFAVDRHSV